VGEEGGRKAEAEEAEEEEEEVEEEEAEAEGESGRESEVEGEEEGEEAETAEAEAEEEEEEEEAEAARDRIVLMEGETEDVHMISNTPLTNAKNFTAHSNISISSLLALGCRFLSNSAKSIACSSISTIDISVMSSRLPVRDTCRDIVPFNALPFSEVDHKRGEDEEAEAEEGEEADEVEEEVGLRISIHCSSSLLPLPSLVLLLRSVNNRFHTTRSSSS